MRLLAALAILAASLSGQSRPGPRFEVAWEKPADGHLVLILAKRNSPEPRFQLSETLDTQQAFGVDVDGASRAVVDGSTLGYPVESLDRVPPGEYFAQAVLNVYETFHRADGHTVNLPADRGEGQQWFRKPGNLYSEPARVRIEPAAAPVRIVLAKVMPAIPPPADSQYIKHVKIESKLLTAFWGRPMYLGAVVVVPQGFDEHPDRHYPVLYYQGHFTATFNGFRPQATNRFYQAWNSGQLPRMLIVSTQDANPYYDDSYAVNSANVGPYGDALVQELYPYVERQFRGIGQPWSRAVYGGSTGGWRALALQIFHPEFFNGAWATAPDPVDFRALSLLNVYEDRNAFYAEGEWKRTPIPMARDREGRVVATMEEAIRYELVLGTKGRSGEQWDIWQAVYGPVGAGGYPAPVFDPRTGAIDPRVADYWKEHYDLMRYLQRNWTSLGPLLAGKLHIASGTADAFYLERSVKRAQEFLESTKEPGKGPYYAGSIEFSSSFGHGGVASSPPPELGNQTFHERVMAAMSERIVKSAPPGADVTSWR